MSINGFRSCGISPWKVKLEDDEFEESQPYLPQRFLKAVGRENKDPKRNHFSKS